MFKKVVLGGTFNTIHGGHRKILETAFSIGETVVIGITSDDFAGRFRIAKVLPYKIRKAEIVSFVARFVKPYEIVPIEDSYGVSTTDPDIDCIVVSEETLLRATEINAVRFKKGLERLCIVVVPLEIADDGKPISGERISAGEIDPEGRVKKK